VFIIGMRFCFQLFLGKYGIYLLTVTVESYLFKHDLLRKFCLRILSDPDPNPNGLIGFGSCKTFGSFRIRIPKTAFRSGVPYRTLKILFCKAFFFNVIKSFKRLAEKACVCHATFNDVSHFKGQSHEIHQAC